MLIHFVSNYAYFWNNFNLIYAETINWSRIHSKLFIILNLSASSRKHSRNFLSHLYTLSRGFFPYKYNVVTEQDRMFGMA